MAHLPGATPNPQSEFSVALTSPQPLCSVAGALAAFAVSPPLSSPAGPELLRVALRLVPGVSCDPSLCPQPCSPSSSSFSPSQLPLLQARASIMNPRPAWGGGRGLAGGRRGRGISPLFIVSFQLPLAVLCPTSQE